MHTDPELLSLLALGETAGSENDRLHAQTCPTCAAEVAELQWVVTLGRDAKTTMAVPSPDVWFRVRQELGLDPTLELPDQRPTATPPPTLEPRLIATSAPSGRRPGGKADPNDELTAHAQLSPVATSWSSASGTATLATDARGRRVLEVALQADLPDPDRRQAWLIHRDDPSVRQTLGILDGSYGLWTVEHSIDLEEYPILDISQQAAGDTEHSGQTIVRGKFTLVS
jgi:hypothetical protein